MFKAVARMGIALSAVLVWVAASALPARAVDFQQEADKAAKAGFVELGKLSTFQNFLNTVGSTKLRHLKVTHVKALTDAITGDVTFFRVKSRILIYSGGGAQSTFIAIEPGTNLRFTDLFGDKAKLFDTMLPSEREMIALAAGDVQLDASDLPADVRKIIAPFFPNSDFTLNVDQGINILSLTDLDKSRAMRDILGFLGGRGSKIAVHASVEGNVLDSLLDGEKPVPDLKFSALLPPFQPYIGHKIRLPSTLQFKLEGAVAANKDHADLGLVTTFKFKHARNEPAVEMELAAKVSQEEGKPPKFKVVAGLPDGKPLRHAFGVKWLTLHGYQMSFAVKGPKLIIGLTGATSFGEKTIKLGGSVLVTAESEGMPVPRTLDFSVSDGPNKVGELSLLDIVKAFEYMSRESGRTVRFNEKNIPDLAIAGTGVGKGPHIALNLKGADNAGFDISGRLLVLGKDVADVKKAYLNTDDGLILKARMNGLPKLGPLQFPSAAINVAFYASKDNRTFEEPRIILKTKSASLFGVHQSLQFVIRPGEFAFLANQDVGSLFKFRFVAYTLQHMRRFADLARADFFMDANLSTHPGEWIRTSGEQAVREAFGALTNDAAAQHAVNKLLHDINGVDSKIKARVKAIEAQRRSQQAKINDAQDKVNKLQGDINNETNTIGRLSSEANRSCNQTKRICVWYDVIKRECTKHAYVPDIKKRAKCTWKRIEAGVQLVGAKAAKAALVASKTVADKTLAALERGISKIPVYLDPQVTYLEAERNAYELSLATARQTLTEFKKADDFLTKGLNVLASSTNGFAIKAARVQGDLRAAVDGKPVVLTLDYVLNGHDYRDRLAYSMKSRAINVAQMKAWVMGIAVHAMTDFARTQPLVPYEFLKKAVSKFETVEAAAQAEQEKALANLHEPGKPSGHYQTIEEAVASSKKTLSASQRKSRAETLTNESKILNAERDQRAAPLIATPGDLLQYTLDNGMFGAPAKGIGYNWLGFKDVFAGADNRFFAIDQSGNFYTYQMRSGTRRSSTCPQLQSGLFGHIQLPCPSAPPAHHYQTGSAVLNHGSSRAVGNGWGGFTHVFNGPPGYVYAINGKGNLLAYHLNGNGGFSSYPTTAGTGWSGCKEVFTNAKDGLYCIHGNGDLYYYHMASNAGVWGGKKIGSGWTTNAAHVFALAGGIIYLIDHQGRLWYYHHDSHQNWLVTHRLAGNGWGPYDRVFSNGRNVFAIRK